MSSPTSAATAPFAHLATPQVLRQLEQFEETRRELFSSLDEDVKLPSRYSWSNVKLESVLGGGGFSFVFEVTLKNVNESVRTMRMMRGRRGYALKCLQVAPPPTPPDSDSFSSSDSQRRIRTCFATASNPATQRLFLFAAKDLAMEAYIFCRIKPHENIVKLHGISSKDLVESYRDSNKNELGYFLLLELLEKETLEDCMNAWKQIVQDEKDEDIPTIAERIKKIAIPIARGVNHIHKHRIVVRDLKPENVGFEVATGRVKLFDFGLAREVPEESPVAGQPNGEGPMHICVGDVAGSYRYMAPETMVGQGNSYCSDSYSFGILLWELLYLQVPYLSCTTREELVHHVVRRDRRPLLDDSLTSCHSLSPSSNAILSTLLEKCWNSNIATRPSFAGILSQLNKIIAEGKAPNIAKQTGGSSARELHRAYSSSSSSLAGVPVGDQHITALDFSSHYRSNYENPAQVAYYSSDDDDDGFGLFDTDDLPVDVQSVAEVSTEPDPSHASAITASGPKEETKSRKKKRKVKANEDDHSVVPLQTQNTGETQDSETISNNHVDGGNGDELSQNQPKKAPKTSKKNRLKRKRKLRRKKRKKNQDVFDRLFSARPKTKRERPIPKEKEANDPSKESVSAEIPELVVTYDHEPEVVEEIAQPKTKKAKPVEKGSVLSYIRLRTHAKKQNSVQKPEEVEEVGCSTMDTAAPAEAYGIELPMLPEEPAKLPTETPQDNMESDVEIFSDDPLHVEHLAENSPEQPVVLPAFVASHEHDIYDNQRSGDSMSPAGDVGKIPNPIQQDEVSPKPQSMNECSETDDDTRAIGGKKKNLTLKQRRARRRRKLKKQRRKNHSDLFNSLFQGNRKATRSDFGSRSILPTSFPFLESKSKKNSNNSDADSDGSVERKGHNKKAAPSGANTKLERQNASKDSRTRKEQSERSSGTSEQVAGASSDIAKIPLVYDSSEVIRQSGSYDRPADTKRPAQKCKTQPTTHEAPDAEVAIADNIDSVNESVAWESEVIETDDEVVLEDADADSADEVTIYESDVIATDDEAGYHEQDGEPADDSIVWDSEGRGSEQRNHYVGAVDSSSTLWESYEETDDEADRLRREATDGGDSSTQWESVPETDNEVDRLRQDSEGPESSTYVESEAQETEGEASKSGVDTESGYSSSEWEYEVIDSDDECVILEEDDESSDSLTMQVLPENLINSRVGVSSLRGSDIIETSSIGGLAVIEEEPPELMDPEEMDDEQEMESAQQHEEAPRGVPSNENTREAKKGDKKRRNLRQRKAKKRKARKRRRQKNSNQPFRKLFFSVLRASKSDNDRSQEELRTEGIFVRLRVCVRGRNFRDETSGRQEMTTEAKKRTHEKNDEEMQTKLLNRPLISQMRDPVHTTKSSDGLSKREQEDGEVEESEKRLKKYRFHYVVRRVLETLKLQKKRGEKFDGHSEPGTAAPLARSAIGTIPEEGVVEDAQSQHAKKPRKKSRSAARKERRRKRQQGRLDLFERILSGQKHRKAQDDGGDSNEPPVPSATHGVVSGKNRAGIEKKHEDKQKSKIDILGRLLQGLRQQKREGNYATDRPTADQSPDKDDGAGDSQQRNVPPVHLDPTELNSSVLSGTSATDAMSRTTVGCATTSGAGSTTGTPNCAGVQKSKKTKKAGGDAFVIKHLGLRKQIPTRQQRQTRRQNKLLKRRRQKKRHTSSFQRDERYEEGKDEELHYLPSDVPPLVPVPSDVMSQDSNFTKSLTV